MLSPTRHSESFNMQVWINAYDSEMRLLGSNIEMKLQSMHTLHVSQVGLNKKTLILYRVSWQMHGTYSRFVDNMVLW